MNVKIIFTSIIAALSLTACFEPAANDHTEAAETTTSGTTASVTTAETTQPEVTAISYTVDTSKPLVALTFDDGPNTGTTPLVLKKLEKYQVPASFFLVGNNITSETEGIVKQAYEMGCEINNHSKTHSTMTDMTPEQIRDEVTFVSDKVEEIIGVPTKFFRPPFIAVDQEMYDNIDMPFICGVGCNDWDSKVSVDERVEKTVSQVKDGTIILLHDSTGNLKTVTALDSIIPQLQEKGYQFVTVSELFEAKGIEISPDDNNLYTYLQ